MDKEMWVGKHYSFFQNKECEFFPCHEIDCIDNFNCIFCYCPLYTLGNKCGGNFKLGDNDIKDCQDCILPHVRENFGYVIGKFNEIAEIAKENM